MPWESQPAGPPRPAPPPPVAPPASPQQMQYDVERKPGYTYQHAPVPPYEPQVVAVNEQTGQRVNVGESLQDAIKQALTESIKQNVPELQANAQKAIAKAASGEKVTVKHGGNEIEGEMQFGASTKRTLLQNLAVDLGFAATTVVAMVSQDDFDFTDPEQWKLLGILLVKTAVTTLLSFMMRLKVD